MSKLNRFKYNHILTIFSQNITIQFDFFFKELLKHLKLIKFVPFVLEKNDGN